MVKAQALQLLRAPVAHSTHENVIFRAVGPMPGTSCPRQSQMMQANSENTYLNTAGKHLRKPYFLSSQALHDMRQSYQSSLEKTQMASVHKSFTGFLSGLL